MDLITTPYWWEQGAPPPTFAPDVPNRCDLAIIGGGFTGMSGALTAAQKGAAVTVFDCGIPGQGASTRNAGMIGAPHRPGFVKELKTYGKDLADDLLREGVDAYRFSRDLYTKRGIDACFQPVGRVQLAYTSGHFAEMKHRAELLNAVQDQGIRIIERAGLNQHINSELYHGALLYPDHGGLHPRMAHDGLMSAAMSAGATVCAKCPVTSIQPEGNGFRLFTPRGSTFARRLIMATNGYTETSPLRWLARRVFRIPSFMVATEELPEGTIDRLAPGRHMMVESRARLSYFRPSPDGRRILFGGRASLYPIDEKSAARRLHETMAQIWPEANDWKLTHAWSGFTGFTFAMVPHLGEHEGIHFALGYCGNGVALSPWLGMKTALRALGDPEGETAFARTRLESRPYHIGGAPWFMRIADPWWRHVVDRREASTAQSDKQ